MWNSRSSVKLPEVKLVPELLTWYPRLPPITLFLLDFLKLIYGEPRDFQTKSLIIATYDDGQQISGEPGSLMDIKGDVHTLAVIRMRLATRAVFCVRCCTLTAKAASLWRCVMIQTSSRPTFFSLTRPNILRWDFCLLHLLLPVNVGSPKDGHILFF